MHFLVVKKSRERSGLVIYSYFMHLRQLKGMQNSKPGMGIGFESGTICQ